MGIWIFYILALIPAIIGGALWIRNRDVSWLEWLIGSLLGFVVAAIFQFASVAGMTSDVETWSGWIDKATHWPRWVEQYQQMHTRQVAIGRDKDGNTTYTTETYYTTEYRTHPERWIAYTTIPDEHEISRSFFQEIATNFGGTTTERPSKIGFYSGDRNSYVAYKRTDYIYPVTAQKRWSNRIKAAPTLFSFAKVPEGIDVFQWPTNSNWRQSDRLLGTASSEFSLLAFDQMNARLGSWKRVNVILIGFGDRDIDIAEWQRAKWIGGKKNDLVLCYGKVTNGVPSWSRVFGWSDSEICKRNLETVLRSNPTGSETLAKLEQEIANGYTIKDWSAFDYITIEPPPWTYAVFGAVLMLSQAGFYWWAHRNDF